MRTLFDGRSRLRRRAAAISPSPPAKGKAPLWGVSLCWRNVVVDFELCSRDRRFLRCASSAYILVQRGILPLLITRKRRGKQIKRLVTALVS